MDNCFWKNVLMIVSILFAIAGLFMSFKNEKGTTQQGQLDPKNGTFSFTVTIGVMLVMLGLAGVFISIKYLPDCKTSSTITDQPSSDSANTDSNQTNNGSKTTLEGWIKDEDGNDVSGAKVSIVGRTESTLSGPDGHFFIEFTDIVDRVSISIQADGYKSNPPELRRTNTSSDFILQKNQ